MRNLLWLLGVLGCIAVAASFRPVSGKFSPSVAKNIRFMWQDYTVRANEIFVFGGDESVSYVYFPSYGMRGQEPWVYGDGVTYLVQQLKLEIPSALQEQSVGELCQQLDLTDHSGTWKVRIGRRPGVAQQRILDLMKASPMPKMRDEMLRMDRARQS